MVTPINMDMDMSDGCVAVTAVARVNVAGDADYMVRSAAGDAMRWISMWLNAPPDHRIRPWSAVSIAATEEAYCRTLGKCVSRAVV